MQHSSVAGSRRLVRGVTLAAVVWIGSGAPARSAPVPASPSSHSPSAPATPLAQIEALRREIARHDTLYHRQAAPEISDADYDQLKRRLRELEQTFPAAAREATPLAEMGDDRTGLFQTQRHREPMLSLEKVYAEAELLAFHARLTKQLGREDLAYVVEPKFDGIAVSVTYENGALVRAVTRGNGAEGDDITANVRKITGFPRILRPRNDAGVPNLIPEAIEIRGEIHVPFAEFTRVNAEREADGEVAFAHPRNLAAGTIRQLDARDIANRGLQVVFYGLGACAPATAAPPTQQALHAQLMAWGLPGVAQTWTAKGKKELLAALEMFRGARVSFTFPTDGAVVKLDSGALQREAGVSEHAPRWAVAFKFAPERAATKLLAITAQVGRTGVITPVAELAPVVLGGSTVSRATLHNRDEITRKDIRVGDSVYVEKAGEIIPAIVGVDLARRPPGAPPYIFPAHCPGCGSAITVRAGEAAVRCLNASCPAQLRRRLEHFASKACVDIGGLGPALIDALVEKRLVSSVADLYRLRRQDLGAAGKNAGKSGDQLLARIEARKTAELWRFIYGLGIPQIGAVTARELARRFGSLEALAELREGQPADRGSEAARNDPALRALATHFADARNRAVVAQLLAAGVRPTAPGAGTTLAGKTFVLTGTLPTLSRAQATKLIESAGGKVSNNVSRGTHYLVVGAEPGAKLAQAQALGVAMIDEAELARWAKEP
ncbi:MAG: hypothetical protein RIQ93_2729 [Verrucomicrobiota bacterium]|jgi:DNA ligase (NAD+)